MTETVTNMTAPVTNATEPVTNITANEIEFTHIETIYYYIWIYSALIIGSVVLLTIRSFMYYRVCMKASKVMHNKMFANILQAPMRFFDTNPSGN